MNQNQMILIEKGNIHFYLSGSNGYKSRSIIRCTYF